MTPSADRHEARLFSMESSFDGIQLSVELDSTPLSRP